MRTSPDAPDEPDPGREEGARLARTSRTPLRLAPALASVPVALLVALLGALPVALLGAGCGGGRGSGLDRQREYVQANPKLPEHVLKAVLGKKLVRGMPMEAVSASWGQPADKLGFGGGDARWKYRKGQRRNNRHVTIEYTLIFNRGVLVSWIEGEPD